jgi:uncharacterized phage protein (TIGR02218 family)
MSALDEHLAGAITTLCHCWRLERPDGWRAGFTDHDRALEFDGTRFEPQSGFSQSEAREVLGLSTTAVDIEGALSSQALSEEDVAAGLFDGALVETFLVNWRDVHQRERIRQARIGKIELVDGRFLAELESPLRLLDRPVGRYLRRRCDAELGDGRCGMSLAAAEFSGAGTVLETVAPNSFRVEGLHVFEAGWFSHGRLTSSGRTFPVSDHRRAAGETIIVSEADMADGATFSIVAGCDKSFATCKAKFGNALNFRGFPHLPGNDAAYGYVTEGVVFDGAPVVP